MSGIDYKTMAGAGMVLIGLGWLAFGGSPEQAPAEVAPVPQSAPEQSWGPTWSPGAQPEAPPPGEEMQSLNSLDPARPTGGSLVGSNGQPLVEDPYAG